MMSEEEKKETEMLVAILLNTCSDGEFIITPAMISNFDHKQIVNVHRRCKDGNMMLKVKKVE